MNTVVFSIAKDFSPHPGPRYAKQGANSGESLRQHLMKILRDHPTKLLIDLDGTKGIGSSFLDEAFGGLVRSEHMSKNDLLNCFEFRSTLDPSYIVEIIDSINRAEPAATH
ncbi:STAS-like domain-containing protein [Novosphingobium sp. UBA1939]|uniref:STAS-like domain-containing protein n=1 Tax=Novosphingobium sp. UBA1939 TaxID=1946982 RepID=UPI0025FFA846|nr:STAS-like domain-containing protein [Novosphingobium sp. UBA1939]